MRIPSGTTDKYLYFYAVDSVDFTTPETGLTTFTVYRSRDGAAASAFTSPTINETSAANMPGVYELLLDEDMTIGAGNDSEEMVFHISHAGMAPVVRTIELYRPKLTAGETLTVSSGLISNTTAIASVSGAVGSVTGAVGSVTGAVGSVTGNVGGNVVGSVASVAGAVGSVTGNVGGNVVGSVGSVSNVSSIQSGLATASDLATVAGYLDTEIAAILEDTGTTLPAQIAALSIPSAATIADAVLDEALSGHVTAGTLGNAIADTETSAAAILVDTGTDIPATLSTIAGYIDTEVAAIKAKTDNLPADPADASDIASSFSAVPAAVWSAVAASNNTLGSMGEKLNDAGSAANPWTEVIESGYTAGQILKIIAAYAAGSATGLDGSAEFTGLDGTTVRIEGTVSGSTRAITAIDAT